MRFFPGQGKGREFCEWPGKFRKDLESQGLKIDSYDRKFVQEGKGCTFS